MEGGEQVRGRGLREGAMGSKWIKNDGGRNGGRWRREEGMQKKEREVLKKRMILNSF